VNINPEVGQRSLDPAGIEESPVDDDRGFAGLARVADQMSLGNLPSEILEKVAIGCGSVTGPGTAAIVRPSGPMLLSFPML